MLLSIIITAHNEGILLHKTILSIMAALDFSRLSDYEILLHLDNATPAMEAYVHSDAFCFDKITIHRNSFGDSGLSRNFCAKKAKGDYMYFIDADDLISENFFSEALKILDTDNILIHPKACLTFKECGDYRCLWEMKSSMDKKTDSFLLFENNMWISSVIGRREIFLKHPYKKTGKGFGHEDYTFNIETTSNNIRHIVAPNTMFFYRKKKDSVLSNANENRLTQYPTDLFSFKKWKELDGNKVANITDGTTKPSAIEEAKRIYTKLRSNRVLNAFITPAATVAKKITGIKLIKPERLPDYVYNSWKNISKIEPQLYPVKWHIDSLERYEIVEGNKASEAYSRICNNIKFDKFDYVFIVPWVTIGGADKVLINYLNALKEIHPNWRIAVITTLPSKNEWAKKLPDNSCLMDFGNEVEDLRDGYERDILFTRIIVQSGAKALHIINSEFGYRWVNKHRALVKNNYELRLSLFCHDIIPNTSGEGIFDYADPLASNIQSLVDKIFTDNDAVIDVLVDKYGYNRKKIKTHYQPIADAFSAPKTPLPDCANLKILWASRVCAQKTPELLTEIARKLDPKKFHIDVYGKLDGNYRGDFFKDIECLSYHGPYNGLKSISTKDYDCFLYTSLIDGLPNTILEIAAEGLPIIASDAGGIKNFITDKKTGLLISSYDAKDYIEALEFARSNPGNMEKFAKNAQNLIEKRHRWDSFIETVKKDF